MLSRCSCQAIRARKNEWHGEPCKPTQQIPFRSRARISSNRFLEELRVDRCSEASSKKDQADISTLCSTSAKPSLFSPWLLTNAFHREVRAMGIAFDRM